MKTLTQMVNAKEIKRADSYKVELNDIHEQAGFNVRDQTPEFWEGIKQFAAYIADGGTYPPLEIRVRPEGGVYVVEGHRRRLALLMARDELGASIEFVSISEFKGNDADRDARIATSNTQEPLKPLELARLYKRMAGYGLTSDEIAAKVHRTRSHVEQMLLLASANTDVQKMVAAGDVSASVATAIVREHGEAAGKKLEGELAKAKASGKDRVTAGTVKGKALPAKVTAAMIDSVDGFMETLTARELEILKSVQSGNAPRDQTVMVSAAALNHLLQIHADVMNAREKIEKRAAKKAAGSAQQPIEA